MTLDESQATAVLAEFKSPSTTVPLAVILGSLGIDRFYLGQIGLGVLRLITAGGFGIWALVDLFTAISRTKKYNLAKLLG